MYSFDYFENRTLSEKVVLNNNFLSATILPKWLSLTAMAKPAMLHINMHNVLHSMAMVLWECYLLRLRRM